MITLKINNRLFTVKKGISILEACKTIGIYIPRFCYHEYLSVAGNCRMCLVEINKSIKPIAACAMPVSADMTINTMTPFVLKARENVLEMLLLNHPLDCPICDQAGECDLQDQSKSFGSDYSRFFFNKRFVEDKFFSSLIKTVMNRCIHCTRCVRFSAEILGDSLLGCLGRGVHTEIGVYKRSFMMHELSGNVIDLCPVGALTNKPYAFKFRPWELSIVESIDLMDSIGSNIYINIFNGYKIERILPKKNIYLNDIWISDIVRFSFDLMYRFRLGNCFRLHNDLFLSNKISRAVSWIEFWDSLYLLYNKTKCLVFLVNSFINVETLNVFKVLKYKEKNIKILTLNNNLLETSNLYRWNKVNALSNITSLKSIKNCFIFSSNIKIENILLNLKIRLKFNKNNIKIYSSGFFFTSNYSIIFISLTIKFFFTWLTGKNFLLSKRFIKFNTSLVIFGKSLSLRFNMSNYLFNILQEKLPSILLYTYSIYSNDEGLSLYNFKKITKKQFHRTKTIIAIELDDILESRQLWFNKNQIVWLHSFGSILCKKFYLSGSLLLPLEEGGTYLNCEQKPQIASRLAVDLCHSLTLDYFLNFFTLKILNIKYNKTINIINYKFLVELVNSTKLLYTMGGLILDFNSNMLYFASLCTFKFLPTKTILEDCYRANFMLKQSLVMTQCSRQLRHYQANLGYY